MASIVVIALMVLPAGCWMGETSGAGGRILPPPPHNSHVGTIGLSNLSELAWHNLEPGPGGGVELSKGTQYSGLADFDVAVSQYGHYRNHVAVFSDGSFVVTWDDGRAGDSDLNVYARIFEAGGKPKSAEIPVCTAPDNQISEGVAVDSQGRFVVAWTDEHLINSIWVNNIYAQRFDSTGARIGSQFTVIEADGGKGPLSMAFDSNDILMVIWQESYRHGPSYGVYGQRIDGNGQKIGSDFVVADGPDNESDCSLAVDSQDHFYVSYWFNAGANNAIYVQRLDSGGNKIGNPVLVASTSYPPSWLYPPRMAIDSNDRLILAWQYMPTSSQYQMLTQRFDTSVTPLGGTVELVAKSVDTFAAIGVGDNGDYFIAWGIADQNSNVPTIYAQHMKSDGTKTGGILTVTDAIHVAHYMNVIVGHDGNPVFIYQQKDQTVNDQIYNIHGRKFIIPYLSSGTLTTGPLAPPHFIFWLDASPEKPQYQAAGTTITVDFSVNNGASWNSVPSNGSLSAAGNATPLRLRLTLGTTDIAVSPLVSGISVDYRSNWPPSVSLPPDFSAWKRSPVMVAPNASDPDLLDAILLSYRWVQTGGPHTAFNSSAPNLSFIPQISGIYTFELTVSDVFNDSPPASINITVNNRPPLASLKAAPTSQVAGQPVLFNASESSDPDDNITAYDFRFGDGNESGWGAHPTASHAYLSPGTYNASVAARDEEGNESASAPVQITVGTAPVPKVSITAPAEGKTLRSRNVSVSFVVENFTVVLNGTHIHLSIDGKPEVMWYSTAPYTFTGVKDGKHTIVVTLNNEAHVKLANPEATATVTFKVAAGSTEKAGNFPILLIVVIILVIAIAAAAFLMMRRRRPTTVIQYQPPSEPPAAPVQPAPPQTPPAIQQPQPPVPPPSP